MAFDPSLAPSPLPSAAAGAETLAVGEPSKVYRGSTGLRLHLVGMGCGVGLRWLEHFGSRYR